MPVPWSKFEQPYTEGPPFLKADAKSKWAQDRVQFFIVGVRGPVKGQYGPQWHLTLQRPGRPEMYTFGMKSSETRDASMREAIEDLRKGESIGPCVFIEKEGDNGTFWVIEDWSAVEARDERKAFSEPTEDLSELPF